MRPFSFQIYHNNYREDPPDGFWSGSELLCYSPDAFPWHAFPSLTLTLAASPHSVFDLQLTPRQYIMLVEPEIHSAEDGDDSQRLCYRFAVDSSTSGLSRTILMTLYQHSVSLVNVLALSPGTVLGAVLMEGLYVVFDQEQHRVGFARGTCPSFPSDLLPTVTLTRSVKCKTAVRLVCFALCASMLSRFSRHIRVCVRDEPPRRVQRRHRALHHAGGGGAVRSAARRRLHPVAVRQALQPQVQVLLLQRRRRDEPARGWQRHVCRLRRGAQRLRPKVRTTGVGGLPYTLVNSSFHSVHVHVHVGFSLVFFSASIF